MKQITHFALMTALGFLFAGFVQEQTNSLITENSAGNVKLGMTVAEVRSAVKPMTLSRTRDGEGVSLIAVKQGEAEVMTLYAGEEESDSKINESAKIKNIDVWAKSFQTTNGVHAGVLLGEVEKKYGGIKVIGMSEVESTEGNAVHIMQG